jgi:hypothetical protein
LILIYKICSRHYIAEILLELASTPINQNIAKEYVQGGPCFALFFFFLCFFYFVCIKILDIKSSLFIWFMMFNATFNNISVIVWLSVSLTDGDFSEMKYTHTHKYCLLFSWIVFHWIVCMANASTKWVIVINAKW